MCVNDDDDNDNDDNDNDVCHNWDVLKLNFSFKKLTNIEETFWETLYVVFHVIDLQIGTST